MLDSQYGHHFVQMKLSISNLRKLVKTIQIGLWVCESSKKNMSYISPYDLLIGPWITIWTIFVHLI